jgi:hypothetical protein
MRPFGELKALPSIARFLMPEQKQYNVALFLGLIPRKSRFRLHKGNSAYQHQRTIAMCVLIVLLNQLRDLTSGGVKDASHVRQRLAT